MFFLFFFHYYCTSLKKIKKKCITYIHMQYNCVSPILTANINVYSFVFVVVVVVVVYLQFSVWFGVCHPFLSPNLA